MSKVNRFEDLRCWQKARNLVKEIYLIAEHGKLSKDFDQEVRSSELHYLL